MNSGADARALGNDDGVRQRSADLRVSLGYCMREALVAVPIVTMALPAGVFITALVTKACDLPKASIGLIAAMPSAANFFQVFLGAPLHHRFPSKHVAVSTALLQQGVWLALVPLLEFLPRHEPWRATAWLAAWFFVCSLLGAIAGVAWNSWIEDWIPLRLRGKFFGRRNRLAQVAMMAFLVSTGWLLGRWDYSLRIFEAIVVVAVGLRLFSLRWIWVSPAQVYRRGAPPQVAATVAEQIAVVRRSHSFLWFVAFGAVWSFATNCFGPFYQVFLFDQLRLSAFEVGLLATVASLGGALSLPAWGRLLDRYGSRPVMAFSLIAWQLQNFLWCFVGPQSRPLVYVLGAWGGLASVGAIASAGFVLGQFTILLRLVPLEAKGLAIGVNLAVTSLAAAVAPIVGGLVLARGLQSGADPLAVYHACFLVQPVLGLAGCALLLRVHEPRASSLTMLIGAMRNVRTLSSVLGLSFLTNYIFFTPAESKATAARPPTRRSR